ncbi:hypothetical protein [Streptomyces sp. NPDC001388]|uniref:hypothetical protein n=1 Tax=Streptomyces sp. NPDC001388 TaxID=3364568 RepID=UPI0036C804A7
MLSLDSDLGGGLSLHDLVATDIDYLIHTAGGVFVDERLNAMLHALDPAERSAYTRTPKARAPHGRRPQRTPAPPTRRPSANGFGARPNGKRLAAEQHRRTAQHFPTPPAA